MNRAVEINPRFTSADGAVLGVLSGRECGLIEISKHDNGVTAVLQAGDGGTMQLFSRPAAGRTPKEIAVGLVNKTFPDTKTAYEIPNTMVGYQHGYGMAADMWPQGAMSSSTRMRVIVMVAVKNDLALIAGAVGPYRAFGPDFGSGSRRRPTCNWPWTWASTSTVSAGAATQPASAQPSARSGT